MAEKENMNAMEVIQTSAGASGPLATASLSDIRILRTSPGKLYLHVANLLRKRIESEEWGPGTRLPALKELAAEFGVANVTLRLAVAILEEEGLVRREQGRGTFVNDTIEPKPTFSVGFDWPSLLKMITKSLPRLITSYDAPEAPPLQAGEGTPASSYRFIKRVNTVNDVPCLFTKAYLDSALYVRAPKQFETDTIIPVIEALPGVHVARCRQVLTIGQADLETATLLNIPVNAPMGEVRRIITDRDGVVIYLNEVAYRGDLVKFEIDLYPEKEAVGAT
ncbi:MAG: GntR family transcriptional regulator [Pseudolabrys sp.]